jgi:hypothetical protein
MYCAVSCKPHSAARLTKGFPDRMSFRRSILELPQPFRLDRQADNKLQGPSLRVIHRQYGNGLRGWLLPHRLTR